MLLQEQLRMPSAKGIHLLVVAMLFHSPWRRGDALALLLKSFCRTSLQPPHAMPNAEDTLLSQAAG